MGNGILRDLGAGRKVVDTVADQQLVNEGIKRLGMSRRQIELNRYWAYARCQQHDDCSVDWDGSQHADAATRASIVAAPSLPGGYVDIGMNTTPVAGKLPLRYRRPSVPCHLGHTIVSRFTSLLFSEAQAPIWKVAGDRDTEDWVQAVSKTYGLWAKMVEIRNKGGGMGTAIFGFKVIAGRVVFECFDARWCTVEQDPADPTSLISLDERFYYPREEQNKETGAWEDVYYWHRRRIDRETDILWKPLPVGDGMTEPKWDDPATVQESKKHGFGFVPVQLVQNLPVGDDLDGDPDCLGCYDYFDRIGELDSANHGGTMRNADPTPVLSSDGNVNEIPIGSKEAIKVEKGGDLKFAETTGTASKMAADESERLEARALRTAECVLADQEANSGGPVTAAEIYKRTASMHAKASVMRSQYGDKGLVPLMTKLVRAARMLATPVQTGGEPGEDGEPTPIKTIVRKIQLPPRVETQPDGGPVQLVDRKLSDVTGTMIELVWPPFSVPSPKDTTAKVMATVQARTGKLITLGTAVRHVSADFNIENPQAEIDELKKEPAPGADLAAQSLTELNEAR